MPSFHLANNESIMQMLTLFLTKFVIVIAGSDEYLNSGFLTLQYAIGKAFRKMIFGKEANFNSAVVRQSTIHNMTSYVSSIIVLLFISAGIETVSNTN